MINKMREPATMYQPLLPAVAGSSFGVGVGLAGGVDVPVGNARVVGTGVGVSEIEMDRRFFVA